MNVRLRFASSIAAASTSPSSDCVGRRRRRNSWRTSSDSSDRSEQNSLRVSSCWWSSRPHLRPRNWKSICAAKRETSRKGFSLRRVAVPLLLRVHGLEFAFPELPPRLLLLQEPREQPGGRAIRFVRDCVPLRVRKDVDPHLVCELVTDPQGLLERDLLVPLPPGAVLRHPAVVEVQDPPVCEVHPPRPPREHDLLQDALRVEHVRELAEADDLLLPRDDRDARVVAELPDLAEPLELHPADRRGVPRLNLDVRP